MQEGSLAPSRSVSRAAALGTGAVLAVACANGASTQTQGFQGTPATADGAAGDATLIDQGGSVGTDSAMTPGVDGSPGSSGADSATATDGSCSSTSVLCDGGCADLTTPANCGACGNACTTSVANAQATCGDAGCSFACNTGFGLCSGACVDFTSVSNCGGCGKTCTGPNPLCATSAGSYACVSTCPSATPSNCSGSCVNETSDVNNCGSCGRACTTAVANAQPTCGDGACSFTCSAPYTLCNGACVDTTSDPNNCSACAHSCTTGVANATAACTASACTFTCNAGFGDCDGNTTNGCEANLTTDPNHCGSCTKTCSTGLCGTSISGWGTSTTLWQTNGSASIGTGHFGAQTGILTTTAGGQAGTIVYKNPIATDTFTASFTLYIGGGSGNADGMGFMLETTGVTAVGGSGGCLGMCGLAGYGIEFDTYKSNGCSDPNSNHVAVDELTACPSGPITAASLPTSISMNTNLPFTLSAGGNHAAVVTLAAGGVISLSLDGTTYLSNVSLPGFVSGTPYYYGFAGGTGGSTDNHQVSSAVSVTFPTARCL